MSWTISDVQWVIATEWLQLSIAGVAIFYGLVETFREWQARKQPRVSMYGRRSIRSVRSLAASLGKAA